MRNGLNFTERGFGVRGAVGIPDRGHTAASQLKPGDFDWDHIFGKSACAGCTPAASSRRLSDTTPQLVDRGGREGREAIRHDCYLRFELPPVAVESIGGQKRAQEVNQEIAKYVDVMIGNEEDFTASLGFEVEGRMRTCRSLK